MTQNINIDQFKQHTADTGSVEVQIAQLTARINKLNEYFSQNKKDYAGRTGLMRLVGQRRRFLAYLHREDFARYTELIKQLGLRK